MLCAVLGIFILGPTNVTNINKTLKCTFTGCFWVVCWCCWVLAFMRRSDKGVIALCNSWQPLSFLWVHNHLYLPCYLLLTFVLLGSFLFFFWEVGKRVIILLIYRRFILLISVTCFTTISFFFSFLGFFCYSESNHWFFIQRNSSFFSKKIWEKFGILYFSCVKSINFSVFGGLKKLPKFLY